MPVWRESAQNQCREPFILPGSATRHRLWSPPLPDTSAKSMTQCNSPLWSAGSGEPNATWFRVMPNYAFGKALQRDTMRFVQAAGGKVP